MIKVLQDIWGLSLNEKEKRNKQAGKRHIGKVKKMLKFHYSWAQKNDKLLKSRCKKIIKETENKKENIIGQQK